MTVPIPTGPGYVREVFNRVRAGDSRVADLYLEEGIIRVPGHQISGREAIRAFYQNTIDTMHPQPEVQEITTCDDLVIAIVDVPTDVGPHDAVDLFDVGPDGIRSLTIFPRHR